MVAERPPQSGLLWTTTALALALTLNSDVGGLVCVVATYASAHWSPPVTPGRRGHRGTARGCGFPPVLLLPSPLPPSR